MTDIELINEDGVIKGVDPETGDEVPIQIDDLITNSIDTNNQNNKISANAQGNDDLAQNILDALNQLEGGRGKITVAPPDDGGTWNWDQDVTIDPANYLGIEIDVDEGTRIDYTNDGWMLTVDRGANGGTNSMTGGATFSLFGGNWYSTSSEPNGAFRLIGAYRTDLRPRNCVGFENSNNDGTYIRVENDDNFTEACRLGGRASSMDIGIDFAPGSVTGGTGGDSFQDTVISWCNLDALNELGVRWRGNFVNVTVNSLTCILAQDNAIGHVFDGVMGGVTMQSPEVEHIAATVSAEPNTIGIETRSNYRKPPLILGGTMENVDTEINRNSPYDDIFRVITRQDKIVFEDIGKNSMEFRSSSGDFTLVDSSGTEQVDIQQNGQVRAGLETFASGNPVRFADGAQMETRSSDPGGSELPDGRMTWYVSDGSTGVTGDDGDVILAVNNGGTVKTSIQFDYSAN